MKTLQILLLFLMINFILSKKKKISKLKERASKCVQESLITNGGSIFVYNEKTYIRLINNNYSGYKSRVQNKSLLTIWKAVQINIDTMIINTTDYTFSYNNSDDSLRSSFGSAFGCSGHADGHAIIDLRGTPFSVDTDWIIGGWRSKGFSSKSFYDQVVEIYGGGSCGWNVPQSKNYAKSNAAQLRGGFLKVKLIWCLNSITLSSGGNFYINLQHSNYSGFKTKAKKHFYNNNSNVITPWYKVRLHPRTLKIDTIDYLYSSMERNSHYHRILFGRGTTRIDLSGTPFKVSNSFEFKEFPCFRSANLKKNGQIIDIFSVEHCRLKTSQEKINNGGVEIADSNEQYFISIELI